MALQLAVHKATVFNIVMKSHDSKGTMARLLKKARAFALAAAYSPAQAVSCEMSLGMSSLCSPSHFPLLYSSHAVTIHEETSRGGPVEAASWIPVQIVVTPPILADMLRRLTSDS